MGLSTAVYLIVKSVFNLPVARFIDKRKGEIDDFITMAIGSVLISINPFFYVFASKPVHIILLQLAYGIGAALAMPGWLAIFTRHIDKHVEAQEWGLYNTMVGLGGALTGALGGFLAERFGFQPLFIIVGVICTFGSTFLFLVYQDIRLADRRERYKR